MTITDFPSGQSDADTQQQRAAGSEQASRHQYSDAQTLRAVGPQLPATRHASISKLGSSPEADLLDGQIVGETQIDAAAEPDTPPAATLASTPKRRPPLEEYALLALAADVLEDAERTRIANENRLRQLTRVGLDKDGMERGFGLDERHPDVARLAALVDLLRKVEHDATLNLERLMRRHPLGAWAKAEKGVGAKQAARLLAVIGDPYWNGLHDRPRTVSELWAYCGLHTLPAGQLGTDAHFVRAGGGLDAPGGNHAVGETQDVAVAARRAKGQKANWSTVAKSRAYLISESMLRAGNRDIYDKRKTATEERTHAVPCIRCGPKGQPAQPGAPWSPGHRHADALRVQSKEMLKRLYRAAKVTALAADCAGTGGTCRDQGSA